MIYETIPVQIRIEIYQKKINWDIVKIGINQIILDIF